MALTLLQNSMTQLLGNSSNALNINGSGNVGIGTSSPGYRLDIYQGSNAALVHIANGNVGLYSWNGSTLSGWGDTVNGNGNGIFFSPSSNFIALQTNSTEKMRLDSSGNLGLGVTPSAWGSSIKALQVGAASYGSIVDLGNGVTSFGSNFYNDGNGNKYVISSAAYPVQYLQDTTSGNHSWRIASAGTAGNTISFTQAMTLDANGRLGIGTTSPGAALHLDTSIGPTTILRNPGASSYTSLRLYNDINSAYRALEIDYFGSTYSSGEAAWIGTTGAYPLIFATGTIERLRIDSSGNLGIGTTSPSAKLDSAGTSAKLTNNGSADVTVQIGPDAPSATRSGRIGFITSSVQKNWYIEHNWNISGSLAFTQTTTAGGSTMGSTPAMLLDSNGNLQINGRFLPSTAGYRSNAGETTTGIDSCMPTQGYSFGMFTNNGAGGTAPTGGDGHIWSATWTGPSGYGCQFFIDTDPTNYVSVRSRSSAGVWQAWRSI